MITEIVKENALWISWYALSATLTIIIIISMQKSRKRRYVYWKKTKINLLAVSREWIQSEDELFNELFSENERLELELKLVKKEVTKLSIANLLILIFVVFVSKLKDIKKH